MLRLLFLILLGLVNVHGIDGLRILTVIPLPWKSYIIMFQSLVRELGERGHEVDFYTPFIMDDPPKTVTQYQLKDRLQEAIRGVDYDDFANSFSFQQVMTSYEMVFRAMEKSFEEGEFQELMSSNKTYEIVLSPALCFAEPLAYFGHRFNAHNVFMTTILDHPCARFAAGSPENPSYMLSYRSTGTNRRNFVERLQNFVTTVSINAACYWNTAMRGQAVADKHIVYDGWESRPKLIDMVSEGALHLINSHPSMAYPIPLAPHIKEIGGVHLAPTKQLPSDLQSFMDDAPHGVIYISFGTNLDTNVLFAGELLNTFVNVLNRLEQKVLWKTNPGTYVPNNPKIRMQRWFPQQDVLGHKNIVLFITHGGLHSMIEALHFGVPTLTTPVLFDQYKDAAYMKSIGVGLDLTFANMTESNLYWVITELLANPRYRKEVKKRQAVFNSRPMQPRDEAVYWIEYIARHGNVMQPASTKLPFYKLYLLDVIATLVLALVVLVHLVKKSLHMVFSYFRTNVNQRKKPMQIKRNERKKTD